MEAKKIVIVGADPDLVSMVHMCLSAYLVPVGIHFIDGDSLLPSETVIDLNNIHGEAKNDDAYKAALPKEIPALDEQAFLRAAADPDVEIIAGAYGQRERDHFLRVLLYCKNKLKIKRWLRHPAYMLDRLSINCDGYICTGYPGSGNMLIQNILAHLTRHKQNANWNNAENSAARAYAFSYWSTLSNYIESHFYSNGFWKSYTGPTHEKYGSLYFNLDGPEGQSVITGLPANAHFWANPWTSSHEPPTASGIDFFEKYGCKFIYIIRNPLDILVSLAGKMTWAGKERAVDWLIDNPKWFEDALQSITYYFQQAKENRDRLVLAHYENFLNSPAQSIIDFAIAIGSPINEHEAKTMWESLSGASLTADAGHYWQPSEGKWMKYIPVEYKRMIKNTGIISLAREFGYTIDLAHLKRRHGDARLTKMPDNAILALEETRFFSGTGKQHSITSSDTVVIKDKKLVAATYKMHEEQFRRLLGSDIFSWVLNAAGEINEENLIATGRELNITRPSFFKRLVG